MPGTGKLTVARLVAAKLGGRLVDNHQIIDEIIKVHPMGTGGYVPAVIEATRLVLDDCTASPVPCVFTNCLAAEIPSDRDRFHQISDAAHSASRPFLQVLLHCQPAENQRRIASQDRADTGKLRDPEVLKHLLAKYTMLHPPTTHELELDTTNLTANQIATIIVNQALQLEPSAK